MNAEFFLGLGEWVSAIAVLITFIYLARQLKQQNRIAAHSTWQTLQQEHQSINRNFSEHPEKFLLYERGLLSPEELDEIEQVQWTHTFRQHYNATLMAHKAFKSGLLPQHEWQTLAQVFGTELDTPGGKAWRARNSTIFPEFFLEIDEVYEPGRSLDHQTWAKGET